MTLSSYCWKSLALVLLFATVSLPPAQAGSADSVPVIVPEVAVYDDRVWIGYNVCPVAVLGPPEGCRGPYRLAEIPIGTDPCSRVSVPGLCGPVPDPCTYAPTAPGLCGPLPSTDVCDYQSMVYPCRGDLCHPTGTTDICNPPCRVGNVDWCECRVGNYWPCYDPCTINWNNYCNPCENSATDDIPGTCDNPLPDACDYAGNAPGVCGNPLPDPCTYAPTAPGLCAPLPSTDVCDYQSMVYPCRGDLCHPTGTTDICNPPCRVGNVDWCECRVGNYWPCYDPCTINWNNYCDPCQNTATDDIPYTCDNPGPSTDVCDYQSTVYPCRGDICHPTGGQDICTIPPIPIVVVDGELCIARQNLDGSDYQRIYCLPINR